MLKFTTFLLIVLLFCVTGNIVAQETDWTIIYGNPDGSPGVVTPGAQIEIPVWAATPVGDSVDSVAFMHNPLASNDTVIVSRDGGNLYYLLDGWDVADYLSPDMNSPTPGYTNQSLLAFSEVAPPYDYNHLNTNGELAKIVTFLMHASSNTDYIDSTICPFTEGWNPINEDLMWTDNDGITIWVPTATYGCLYFAPPGFLAGTVTDAGTSSPIEGVEVLILNTFISAANTDSSGGFLLDAPAGDLLSVRLSHLSYQDTIIADILIPSMNDTTFLNVAMSPEAPGQISGIVTDSVAIPLEGVHVSIIGTDYKDTTDASGMYLIADISPEIYNLGFSKVEYGDTAAFGVQVNPGQNTVLNMHLPARPLGVKIRGEYVITQNAFDIARDLHFKVWQKEDLIEIVDWVISVSHFTDIQTQRGYRPPPFDYGSINHAIDVDCTGGSVPRGTEVTISVIWWLTYWNAMNLSNILWTDDGTILTEAKVAPDFGWTIGYPDSVGQDSCLHEYTMTNYDSVETLYVRDLGFYGSMNYEYSLQDISSSLFEGVAGLDSTLSPGDSTVGDIPTKGGCDYITGDVNGVAGYNGLDITYGVSYLKGGSEPECPFGSCPIPPCDSYFYCGDVNGSCNYNGLDITYGVAYLKGGDAPFPCPDCPPAGGLILQDECLIGGHIYGRYKLYDPDDSTFSIEATFDHEVVEEP